MQTLKTSVIVVLLLVVLYGVYEVLNRPPDKPPKEIAEVESQLEDLEIGLGGPAQSSSFEPTFSASSEPGTTSTFPGGTMPNFDAPPVYGAAASLISYVAVTLFRYKKIKPVKLPSEYQKGGGQA